MDKLWACYVEYWKRYAEFSGRTSRRDFWYVVLFEVLLSMIIGVFEIAPSFHNAFYYIESIYSILTFIPTLAIESRRLIDAGKSPFNLFFWLLPIVGWIILLVYFCKPTKAMENTVTREDVGL